MVWRNKCTFQYSCSNTFAPLSRCIDVAVLFLFSKTASGSAVGVSEASTTTCRFAIDDYLESFYYDGIDVTKRVTGDHDRWDSVNTVTFTEISNATMAIYAREGNCNRGETFLRCKLLSSHNVLRCAICCNQTGKRR